MGGKWKTDSSSGCKIWDPWGDELEEPSYEGPNLDGKAHGTGKLTWTTRENGRSTYSGEFEEGRFEGNGEELHANGEHYKGEYRGGKRHGMGELKCTNGDVVSGHFADDLAHGNVVMLTAQGDRYVGEASNGAEHGRGTFTWKETGTVFEGTWVNGDRHGPGEYTLISGKKVPVLYKHDELAVDPATVPDDYQINMCMFLANVLVEDVDDFELVESSMFREDTDTIVSLRYETTNRAGDLAERTASCRLQYNDRTGFEEVVEGIFAGERIDGESMKAIAEDLALTIWGPDFDEE